MNGGRRYRSRAVAGSVVGLSLSYERENLLSRGLGLEHLRELLIRVARPVLRQGACISYGGVWKESEDNFTYELLRLISAEQEDNSLGGADSSLQIGRMFNHVAWPHYCTITPEIEARWINYCRIVRVSPQLAGIPPEHVLPDTEQVIHSPEGRLQAAVALSAMRRLTMAGVTLEVPNGPSETIPAVVARVLLGGRLTGYSGFMPGVLEEALVTLEFQKPLYILGGFGGAGEVLTRALLGDERPDELTPDFQVASTPNLRELADTAARSAIVQLVPPAGGRLEELWQKLLLVRANLAEGLNTGLSLDDTVELLTTSDTLRAANLVREGLRVRANLRQVPG